LPIGFIITRWTEEEGLILELKYPDTILVDLDDQMRVFYAHITGKGTAGTVVVRLEKSRSKVASYFTGMESEPPRLINLMLELSEDPEMYGDFILEEINQPILNYLKKKDEHPAQRYEIEEDLKNFLETMLFYLDWFKNLSKEQRLAQIYMSLKGLKILQLLREQARSRKELLYLLEKETGELISNIDVLLDPFIKTGIVKQDWIEGINDIYLFLLNDFILIRKPAVKIIEEVKKDFPTPEVAEKYLEIARKFFSEYQPTLEDSIKIARNMLNPDKYDLIALFRERMYPIQKIPKSTGRKAVDFLDIINKMVDDRILILIKDESNTEWVSLLTDVGAETFYPEFLIEKIRKDHFEENINPEIAIKHLELLEKAYSK